MINNVDYYSRKTSCNSVARGLKLLVGITPTPKHNLDYGGGKYDKGTQYLAQHNIINHVYDPYNRTPEQNKEALWWHFFDSVTLLNVLNVIEDRSERVAVVRDAYSKLSSGGVMIIQIYEGNCSGVGVVGKTKTYQHNHKMSKYFREICEGIGTTMFRFNVMNDGVIDKKNKSFIITKP